MKLNDTEFAGMKQGDEKAFDTIEKIKKEVEDTVEVKTGEKEDENSLIYIKIGKFVLILKKR